MFISNDISMKVYKFVGIKQALIKFGYFEFRFKLKNQRIVPFID